MATRVIKRRSASHVLESGMSPLLARVYAQRGVRAEHELNYSLQALLPPGELLGIDAAADLLQQALQQQQRILIIGDYDCDGATSTALMMLVLRQFGAEQVHYLVPNRFEYGYGLTPEIVEVAAELQPDLLITVDNGIASLAGVQAAKARGMRVLITDHHLPGEELPAADVIVNPNQVGDRFACKATAGVGVAFYVLSALRARLRQTTWFADRPEPRLADYLDLVALGTVADVVPLEHNNRILVEQGLQRIRRGQSRPGIAALLRLAGRDRLPVSATDLAFALAPRINAAGRMDDMTIGIECLLADDPVRAAQLAEQLDSLNQERRAVEADMQTQALQLLAGLPSKDANAVPAGVCIYESEWHQGVIGILAARIRERVHRPVIAFADADLDGQSEWLKGSARSIPGLHIRDALDRIATSHPHILSKFGGHAMAAGLSLQRQHLAEFSALFADTVLSMLNGEIPEEVLFSDGALAADEFVLPLAQQLRLAGPWGQGFPEPLFDGEFTLIKQRLLAGKHLKLLLSPADGQPPVDAIYFNFGSELLAADVRRVFIVYGLDVNDYNQQQNLQLKVEHLQAC